VAVLMSDRPLCTSTCSTSYGSVSSPAAVPLLHALIANHASATVTHAFSPAARGPRARSNAPRCRPPARTRPTADSAHQPMSLPPRPPAAADAAGATHQAPAPTPPRRPSALTPWALAPAAAASVPRILSARAAECVRTPVSWFLCEFSINAPCFSSTDFRPLACSDRAPTM
jgi:hypothetical protein